MQSICFPEDKKLLWSLFELLSETVLFPKIIFLVFIVQRGESVYFSVYIDYYIVIYVLYLRKTSREGFNGNKT